MSFQSTHPLRGATRHGESLRQRHGISIHAPLAGCDGRRRLPGNCWIIISIHAPLAGCDAEQTPAITVSGVFQSTHPLRGATRSARRVCLPHNISIHAPLAGCDRPARYKLRMCAISIHAPLAGCDPDGWKPYQEEAHFNPRTPCGVRPRRAGCAHRPADYFNPRTPCGVRRCNF